MIRFYTPADIPAMLAIYRPHVEGSLVSFEYETPSLAAFSRRMEEIARFYPVLVCERGGRVAGFAYAHRLRERKAFDWSAETTVYVGAPDAGLGAGRALYGALFSLLEAQHIRSLYALITASNASSVHFHEAMGFVAVFVQKNAGYKLGRWADLVWMERLLPAQGDDPRPIVSVHDLPREEITAILKKND